MRSRFPRAGHTASAAIAALALVLVGCAGHRAAELVARSDAACTVANGEPPAQLRVGVADPVRSENAPVPRNASERLVFGHLYETLVRVDCRGDLVPGLAEAWSIGNGGRSWTFRLRQDAAFTDGSPANAPAVIAAWSSMPSTARAIDSLFSEVVAPTPRELRIITSDSAAVPRLLAQPVFAVARRIARGWPTGTGAYRVAASSALQIRMLPRAGLGPAIDVLVTGNDARSALDDDIDVIVTGDTRTIEYARVLPGYVTTPLPWSRTYVLTGGTGDSIPAEVRASLAREAVRGEVRAAEPPFWWMACQDPTTRPPARTRAIAYAAGDTIARGLAERIAALSWPPSRTPDWLQPFVHAGERAPTVQPVNPQNIRDAIRRDPGLVAIIALPRTGDCSAPASAGYVTDAALVDARDHLIRHGDIGRVIVDAAGAPRFGAVR